MSTRSTLLPISLTRSNPSTGRFVPTLYRLSMQTGLRALWNRTRALCFRRPELVATLHKVVVTVPGLGPMRLAVHARPTPEGEDPSRRFAMVSARQLNRRHHRWAYRYLLATSHFGCGHLELACFEEQGQLTFFGIRNMARANAVRFGLPWMGTDELGTLNDTETEFARACRAALHVNGTKPSWTSPTESVQLSMQPRLLALADRPRFKRHLVARYLRLQTALAAK